MVESDYGLGIDLRNGVVVDSVLMIKVLDDT